MGPTLRQIRSFLAVVEAGSVSEAAAALGLTQPAASQQLRELERSLGVRLLERAKGRVLPTAAGEAILAPARRALAAVDDIRAGVAAFRDGAAGRVRLGTGATACIHLLPPVLAALKAQVPGAEVIISIGNTTEMLRQVEEGSLDAALVTLPAPISRALCTTVVATDPLLALLPRDLVPPGRAALSATELLGLPLILYEPGGSTRAIIDGWFRRAGQVPQPVMELGSIEAIKVLVGNGSGGSVVPALALAGAAGEVPGAVACPLSPPLSRRLAIVLRREKVLDRVLRALLSGLQAHAGAGAAPSLS
ncbi:LysR family transcriptional regulator [Rhodovastum atsumiense]|uniref:LysR family transcriptional regulator n=1 Tax=Rhodovastum atsumiense TaxID=504468 RepID=A0A5M6IQB4_9PROT|nr:LysR family transcriptional regulator [Rhodovastum atsumiense]KAA5610119.1 LysR family transcriptional regulator [Rhodovastum atsumiense]CAH2601408.1 LysR family transcriptional regulator [Rhodovastum atsumiense]